MTTPSDDIPAPEPAPSIGLVRQARLESLIGLASGVAHDLNNYVAAIQGNNEILARRLPEDSSLRINTELIGASTTLSLELAEQLATFSGRVVKAFAPLSLPTVAAGMEEQLRDPLRAGIELTLQVAEDMPELQGDVSRISAVMLALVENAAEAISADTGLITLTIDACNMSDLELEQAFFPPAPSPGTFARIEVSDDGNGMTPKILECAFDPFFSTKIRGRGMGLPQVIGTARLHAGTVMLNSKPGAGTTVTVLLPMA